MASEVLGEVMDFHLAGMDLKFPHNDNELAQSTAYWSKKGEVSAPWVNYFLHIGHLGIQGLKMSKSLKNFRTIREALESDWNPRSLRVAFLLNAWQDPIELGDELLASALAWESKLENIFLKAIDVTRWPSGIGPTQSDKEVLDSLQHAKDEVHAALCDSFHTPAAMRAISTLITKANTVGSLADDTLLSVARWITRMVAIFGLDADGDISDTERIGFQKPLFRLFTPYQSSETPFESKLALIWTTITSQNWWRRTVKISPRVRIVTMCPLSLSEMCSKHFMNRSNHSQSQRPQQRNS